MVSWPKESADPLWANTKRCHQRTSLLEIQIQRQNAHLQRTLSTITPTREVVAKSPFQSSCLLQDEAMFSTLSFSSFSEHGEQLPTAPVYSITCHYHVDFIFRLI